MSTLIRVLGIGSGWRAKLCDVTQHKVTEYELGSELQHVERVDPEDIPYHSVRLFVCSRCHKVDVRIEAGAVPFDVSIVAWADAIQAPKEEADPEPTPETQAITKARVD